MGEHSEISPSGLHCVLHCPGCVNTCRLVPDEPSSKYAAEGSCAHHLGETCLTEVTEPEDYLGQDMWCNDLHAPYTGFGEAPNMTGTTHFFKVSEDMIDAVTTYVDYVRAIQTELIGGIFQIEERLSMEHLVPGMFGTGDHVAIEPLNCLYITDYKHGAGVAVEVEDNPQLLTYGLGAIGANNIHMVEEVVITLVQPRAIHHAGPIRSISLDASQLVAWGHDVLVPGVKRTMEPDAPTVAGPWCKDGFCAARDALDVGGQHICPARREQHTKAVGDMFGDDKALTHGTSLIAPDPTTFDGERLNKAMLAADIVEAYIKAIRVEGYNRHYTGSADAPADFKLIAGNLSNRAYRKGVDVYNAVKTMVSRKDAHAPEQVKSPAQMEAALKRTGMKAKEARELIDTLIQERKPGKPKLVHVTDRSPAIANVVETMFK